jgi:hypothetical protein
MSKPILSAAEIKLLPFLGFEEMVEEFDYDLEPDGEDDVLAKILGKGKRGREFIAATVVLDMSRIVSFSERYLEDIDETVVSVFLEGGAMHNVRMSLVPFMAKLVEYRRIREVTAIGKLLFSAS